MTSLAEEEVPAAEEKEAGFDFDDNFQKKVVALMLRDAAFAGKTQGLIEPGFFEREVDGALAKLSLDYYEKYRTTPSIGVLATLIKDEVAAKRLRKDMVRDMGVRLKEVVTTDLSDAGFVTDKVAEFARNKAMERAILASVEDLEKRDYARIKKRFDQAMMVGATRASTLNYFERIEARTDERKARVAGVIKRDGVTTGVEEIDKYLYHNGWGRKELSCILGPAKAGKSMSLGDFGLKASMAGHNVLYMSCEVAAKIIEERCDANLSEVMMKKLDDNIFAVQDAVKKIRERPGAGLFLIEEYASNSLKPSEVRRALEALRAQGIIIDLLIVDYADIMAPEMRSESQIDNMRSIFLDLRAITFDYNLAGLTATQSNREGAKKMTATAVDVAEDFNKVRTVDLLLSINATEAEKAAGEARIFWAASRNGESEFTLRIKQDRATMRFVTKVIGRE